MTEIACTTITAITGIIVALLGIRIKRSEARADERFKMREARDDEAARFRRKESLLSLKMMYATLDLSKENSIGLLSGNNLENIQDALDRANSVSTEYQEFLQEVTAHEVGK